MPWDMAKCLNGVPAGFSNLAAINLVANANFNNPAFVQTHANGQTKSAFTYVPFGGMTLCVAGHIHLLGNGAVAPGNSYIPGWTNWAMLTPQAAVLAIQAQPAIAGAWPGVNRYPH